MATEKEPVVQPSSKMPQSYIFVPKGDVYITKNCRKLTQEAEKTVYVVQSADKVVLGLRVPQAVFAKVQELDVMTKQSRAEAVQKKDNALETKVRNELERSFPMFPQEAIDRVLAHTLEKRTGRVGRSTDLPAKDVVALAVRAFIRHKYTDYDKMMNKGMEREAARTLVQPIIDDKVREWGGKVRSTTPTRPQQTLSQSTSSRQKLLSKTQSRPKGTRSGKTPRSSILSKQLKKPLAKRSTSTKKKAQARTRTGTTTKITTTITTTIKPRVKGQKKVTNLTQTLPLRNKATATSRRRSLRSGEL